MGFNVDRPRHTLELSEVYMELISFLQNLLPTTFDECVKFGGKLGHAIAQILEAKVNAGQRVGH